MKLYLNVRYHSAALKPLYQSLKYKIKKSSVFRIHQICEYNLYTLQYDMLQYYICNLLWICVFSFRIILHKCPPFNNGIDNFRLVIRVYVAQRVINGPAFSYDRMRFIEKIFIFILFTNSVKLKSSYSLIHQKLHFIL